MAEPRTTKWEFGYVWKDETGNLHIEEMIVATLYGCVILHIPTDHLNGLMAGPWLSQKKSA